MNHSKENAQNYLHLTADCDKTDWRKSFGEELCKGTAVEILGEQWSRNFGRAMKSEFDRSNLWFDSLYG